MASWTLSVQCNEVGLSQRGGFGPSLKKGVTQKRVSGQIITTSAEVTLNCGLVRELP